MSGQLESQITAAFGLGSPTGHLVAGTYTSQPTWTLATTDGRVLLKRVSCDGWRAELDRAMRFEQRALDAGIAIPRPIRPVAPVLGVVAEIPGWGQVRAYEWIDGRPLADTDDIANWLGATLARLHQIEPLDHAEPQWYGLYPEQQWQAWLSDGLARRCRWAPVLRRRLADVLAATAWISQAFRAAGDYVMTHRDVEPWNVLMTDTGPVLVDWDTAGPDSAGLEMAHAATMFALHGRTEPDRDALHRTLLAYERHGGRVTGDGRDLLARRAGLRLTRLSERVRMSLDQQEPGSVDRVRAEHRAAEQLDGLPAFLDNLDRWSRLIH